MNDRFKEKALQSLYEHAYLHENGAVRLFLLNIADLFTTVAAFLVSALLLSKDYTVSVLLLMATAVVKIENKRVLSAYESFSAYRHFRNGHIMRTIIGVTLLGVILLVYAWCSKKGWVQPELLTIPFIFLMFIYVFIVAIENGFGSLELPADERPAS